METLAAITTQAFMRQVRAAAAAQARLEHQRLRVQLVEMVVQAKPPISLARVPLTRVEVVVLEPLRKVRAVLAVGATVH